jgi:hypothetical protein
MFLRPMPPFWWGLALRPLSPTRTTSDLGLGGNRICGVALICLITLIWHIKIPLIFGHIPTSYAHFIGMGNCCGKESGAFQGEGRTLGASPATAPPQTDGARASAPPKISAPKGGRTLGKNPQSPDESSSPKQAAARAAEVCSSSTSSKSLLKGSKSHASPGRMVATAWL